MAITRTEKWTREDVMGLTREEVIELWKQCPAAQVTELVGEFDGLLPNAGNHEGYARLRESMLDEISARRRVTGTIAIVGRAARSSAICASPPRWEHHSSTGSHLS